MSPTTAPIIEPVDSALNERDRIFLRRCEELCRAGYGAEAASLLAANPDIDLDLAVKVRARRLCAV